MAGIAGLVELALMRIAMAIGTILEFEAFIARLPVRAGGVAILAEDVPMLPGEGEARGGVIEGLGVESGCFPVAGGMAA